jgi:hypothetical protein
MTVPMNMTRFHVAPKAGGVELIVEIDGKVAITANASLEQVEETIDALENVLSAEDEDEGVVSDEG